MMSASQKKSRFFTKPDKSDHITTMSSSTSLSSSALEVESALTKRSRFFQQQPNTKPKSAQQSTDDSNNKENNRLGEGLPRKKRIKFDDILRQFKASRSRLRDETTSTTTTTPPTDASAAASSAASAGNANQGTRKEEVSCPICLCVVPEEERAGPNTCQHSCFCFPCLVAWGRVVNKCPLCKTAFTEVISVSHPQRKETFSTKKQKSGSDNIDDGDEEEEEGEEIELDYDYDYDAELAEVRQLYGYDESDGFVVGEDVVEFDSADEDDSFLDL
jgi:hypothetical protein